MGQRSKTVKICLVSSSGGHWEQLKKLKPLIDKYGGFYVTERTPFVEDGPYLMVQTDLKDRLMPLKMLVNAVRALGIWMKERPDVVVTTGTMVAYPFYLLAVLLRKKFVFIETFGRSNEPTVAGRLMQKHADLFFVQWESQKRFYDNAIYVGCLY
ncbi:beta-1,4-galactosyltransferase enhancer [Collinsella tanakaei]|nr:beta-1,4-galactosyltransferase enhancer [Collinsella tanakaei]